mgnify:CR=1 FL=1
MLKIFEPYMSFIAFAITIIVNIILIKNNVNWIILIVGNLLVTLLLSFLDIEYNFLGEIISEIGKIILEIVKSIFKALGDIIRDILNISDPDTSFGGGGGGFRDR